MAAVFLFYGSIGASVIERKVVPRLEGALGRKVKIGDIDVSRGHAVLSNVVVSGPADGEAPLAKVARVDVDFGFWASLRGQAEVKNAVVSGLEISLLRRSDGSNNFEDILTLRERRKQPSDGGGKGLDLSKIKFAGGRIKAHDDIRGVTLLAYDVNVAFDADRNVSIDTGELAALTQLGPHAKFANARITFALKNPRQTGLFEASGGEATLWSGMNLTGITGSARVMPGSAGRFAIDLSGGYGDVAQKLFHVKGWVDPVLQICDLELNADRFTFDKLAPVLKENPHVIDYEKTSLNTKVHLVLEPTQGALSGNLEISGLNLFHEKVAKQPVRNISIGGEVEAKFDRVKREGALDVKVLSGGVTYLLHSELEQPLAAPDDPDPLARKYTRWRAHLQIPEVSCQRMLESIPPDFIPDLNGFRLSGRFAADVKVNVDWADLEATTLEGGVGIRGCKVLESPANLSAKRLSSSFEHQALVGLDPVTNEEIWETMVIGPENPAFVPLTEVSPYVVKAFLTTEDSTFYDHKGFITREFRTALIRNLEAGAFRFGASSITMQMIKNVFLRREKTLSRKFQELFLTWYIETQLDKDRIMEIYVNAIEYGPGLYGIRPAAEIYFGKHPMDINPVEAAFFSSILPAPTRRFTQFCKDRLSHASENKVARILGYMHERDRLTPEEYTLAQATPLVFAPDKKPLCSKGGYYEYRKKKPRGSNIEPVLIPLPVDENAGEPDGDLDDELDALDGDR